MKKFKKLLSVIICFCMIFAGITFADHTEVSATPNSYSRLGGATRYLTSIQISQDGWPKGSDYVVIASGEKYPDALCAAPLAKLYDAPILLTPYGSLAGIDANNSLEKEIYRLHPSHAFIIGGAAGAVSDQVKIELQNLGVPDSNIERLYGDDRYGTSLAVAQKIEDTLKSNNSSITGVAVASGENYPDALSIASIAAAKKMPILLTEKASMNSSVSSFIQTYNKNNTTYVIGGSGVIIDDVCNALPNHKRLGGIDRYHTNLEVINEFTTNSDTSLNNLYIAYSYGFADALSGSAEAAKDNAAILLAYYNDIPDHMKDILTYIHSNLRNINTVKVLGGTGVVSDAMANKIIYPDRTVLGYTYGGSTTNGILSNYTSTIDEIATFTFSAGSDGHISNGIRGDGSPYPTPTSTIDLANSLKTRPMALVTNGFDYGIADSMLSSETYRQNFITDIISIIQKYHYSGVNVDFENVYDSDRNYFTTFIKELYSALHPLNYFVTVSVPAKEDESTYYAFDYAAIGQYTDQVAIMTYDDTPGTASCTAPINWVQNVINYAIDVAKIPSNKILLGLEPGGRNWCEHTDKDGNTYYTYFDFEGIDLTLKLAADNNASFIFEKSSDGTIISKHFRYIDGSGVPHQVWLEDKDDLAAKLNIVNNENLGGVAIWELSATNSDYLNLIKSMLRK